MSRLGALAWRWGPAAAYVALVYSLSLEPGTPVPGTVGVDKLLHVVEYGLLGLLLARGGLGAGRAGLAALVVVGLAIGVGDELIQSTVPGRTAGAPDAVADAVGVAMGVALGPRLWTRGGFASWA